MPLCVGQRSQPSTESRSPLVHHRFSATMTGQAKSFPSPWVRLHVRLTFYHPPHPAISIANLIRAFKVISTRTTFNTLPANLKSLAVRTKVRYAPHPYVWMAPARSRSTGLGLEMEGKELPLNELPEWDESKVKTFPMVLA